MGHDVGGCSLAQNQAGAIRQRLGCRSPGTFSDENGHYRKSQDCSPPQRLKLSQASLLRPDSIRPELFLALPRPRIFGLGEVGQAEETRTIKKVEELTSTF